MGKTVKTLFEVIQMKNDEGRNYSRALLKRVALPPDMLRSEIDGSWDRKGDRALGRGIGV